MSIEKYEELTGRLELYGLIQEGLEDYKYGIIPAPFPKLFPISGTDAKNELSSPYHKSC